MKVFLHQVCPTGKKIPKARGELPGHYPNNLTPRLATKGIGSEDFVDL